MRPLADAVARERIRADLDSTLVVEASAGTGKTTELVHRILALVLRGKTTLSRIVAVTFTEKAAGEMKLRLRSEIERARGESSITLEEKSRLDGALAELEEARIGTIHGFCADVLRERAVEAKVDPLFEVASEEVRDRIYGEAFEQWFQEQLDHPPPGVRRMLRRRSRDRDATGPKESLRRAGLVLVDQRDFDAPWRRDAVEVPAAIDGALAALRELAAYAVQATTKDDYLVKNLLEIRRFSEELAAREAVRDGQRDYDGLESELTRVARLRSWNWRGSARAFRSGALRNEILARREAVREELDRTLELIDADLAACLYPELGPLVEIYERKKARAGKLDFLDLLVLARNLLRDDRVVRNELQSRFSHLLVDEFQDTDPLQADILLLLAADDPAERDVMRARSLRGKLFVVGDPKQSIYRFRRADVALYEATKRRLVANGAEVVHLTTSFRSAPSIQAAVNAAFAPLMQGSEDGSQAEYVPLSPFREEPVGFPTVIALPVPRPYADYGKIVNYRIDESVPDAVGAFVDFLIRKSGFLVTERERPDQRVPVAARHICLLFKRFQQLGEDITRPYVRALEARHVPHVLVGGRSFHAREEVLALRNALSAIEWPDDELRVYATLRGPFFAVGDDALLAFRQRFGRLHTLRKLDPPLLTDLTREVATALGILGRLHRRRNRRPVADTLAELLEATRAHAGVAIWPTGEQALGNILRVLDLARRFEGAGATSFRSFVARLEEESERGGAAEAPVVEEGTDGVRIMTVHKAKGLEFPVVILVDPTAPSTPQKPSRYVDPERRLWSVPLGGCVPIELIEKKDFVLRHDREEALRLLYVAATRAREMLVVPVVGDESTGSEHIRGWVDALHPILYPRPVDRRSSAPVPGCPPFGEDSVYERPASVGSGADGSVRPGLHRPEIGEHRVVFWDPHQLELDKKDDVGLRQQRILAADEGGAVATEGERLHAQWVTRRTDLLARGATPSMRVATVTEQKAQVSAGATPPSIAVTLEQTDVERRGRSHGKRFGVLVHGVLAIVPLDAPEKRVLEVARGEGRLLGASADEVEAAAAAVSAALRHPLLARARAAPEHRRECPVAWRAGDGSLIEGVLDLAFSETEGGARVWRVIDFKTDVELSARRAEYELQLALYAAAIRAATGDPVTGSLLWV